MIQRFYDPDGGAVLVDGRDMRDIDLFGWREEPSLFAGTISENVRVGKANIHDVIMSLPQQYQTDIGTVGSQLSGGQKQRIAIARAIVKNPKILILDEATSALDRKSEVEVQSALDKVMNEGGAKLTVIVIAHRLATIRNADVIHFIVTDEVRGSTIAESGTFSELVKLNGHFATMTRRQSCEAVDDDSSPGEKPAADHVPLVAAKKAVSGEPAAITIEPEEQGLDRQDTLAKRVEKEVESRKIPYLRILKMNRENMWAVVLGMLGSLISGGVYPVLALVEGNVLDVLGTYANDPTELRRKLPLWASLFFVVAVAAVIGWMLQTFYALAGERLTTKLRSMLFRHILRQDQAFFDMPGRDAGAMAGVLSGDCEAVHQLWGTSIGFKVQMACNLAAGFAISFAYAW